MSENPLNVEPLVAETAPPPATGPEAVATPEIAACAVVPFDFEGANVRVVMIDGEPWFVAKDVADLLGYTNSRKAISDHCRGVTKRYIPTSSGMQEMTVIPERDVYRLIMRSKLPGAERFEEWVVGTVLPSIRKTGSFGVPVDPMVALNDPATLRGLLLTYSEKMQALETRNTKLTAKAEALDDLAEAEGSFCITDTAKLCGVRPKVLFTFMAQTGWIYRRAGCDHYVGYQSKLVAGLLEHKVTKVLTGDGVERVTEQVRVTARGLTVLAQLVKPVGVLV